MTKMRAKFQCITVTKDVYGETLKFTAVCGDSKDDNTFAEATPSGQLEMYVSNKSLHGAIKPGQKFYLDFTLAE
jgi:hypothetical protein